MDNIGLDELVYLYRLGDQEAFEILLTECTGVLMYNISKGNYDLGKYGLQVDDLKQIAILSFYKALHSYRDDVEANFKTFLSICVRRDMQAFLKKATGSKQRYVNDALSLNGYISNEDDATFEDFFVSNESNPEEILLELEAQKTLFESRKLSDLEKKIVLYRLTGYNNKEIAKILHISLKTVFNAVVRIKKKIAEV